MDELADGPRFLFASDSLKGTLSSLDAAARLEAAACRHFPGCSCRAVPMADGGEGTTEALVAACTGSLVRERVAGPLGEPVEARYGLLGDGRAIVEVAAASGLTLVPSTLRDPLLASTYGTGQLIRSALDRGARDVTVALGGSATNDGGMGCMRALGVRFLDETGTELAGTGADLGRVTSIDLSGLDARIAKTTFHAMCDVDNPLVGPVGAAATFAPQKGASPQVVALLEEGMRSYASVLARAVNVDVDVAGGGAAGGMGAACLAYLGADLVSGVGRVLELVGFDDLLAGVDVCVTGEGHLDAQTERGKVVAGVAEACRRRCVPCVAVVGGMDADVVARGADAAGAASDAGASGMGCNAPAGNVPAGNAPASGTGGDATVSGSVGGSVASGVHIPGLSAVVPTVTDAIPLDQALAHAPQLYNAAADRLFSLLALGARMGGLRRG